MDVQCMLYTTYTLANSAVHFFLPFELLLRKMQTPEERKKSSHIVRTHTESKLHKQNRWTK